MEFYWNVRSINWTHTLGKSPFVFKSFDIIVKFFTYWYFDVLWEQNIINNGTEFIDDITHTCLWYTKKMANCSLISIRCKSPKPNLNTPSNLDRFSHICVLSAQEGMQLLTKEIESSSPHSEVFHQVIFIKSFFKGKVCTSQDICKAKFSLTLWACRDLDLRYVAIRFRAEARFFFATFFVLMIAFS